MDADRSRITLLASGAALALSLARAGRAGAQATARPEVTVYKPPT